MRVSEVMSSRVVSVAPTTPFKALIKTLLDAGVSGLPVVDGGRVVGIVTDADLIPKEAYAGRRRALAIVPEVVAGHARRFRMAHAATAADVMTHDVVVCAPDDDLRAAARRMCEHRVKRMPVVADGLLVGIVTRHDVLGAFNRPDDRVAADVESALSTDPNRPDDAHVVVSVEGGVVTLDGDVRYHWDEPVVVSIARDVPGVIDVSSKLHAREPDPRSPRTPWMYVPH